MNWYMTLDESIVSHANFLDTYLSTFICWITVSRQYNTKYTSLCNYTFSSSSTPAKRILFFGMVCYLEKALIFSSRQEILLRGGNNLIDKSYSVWLNSSARKLKILYLFIFEIYPWWEFVCLYFNWDKIFFSSQQLLFNKSNKSR